jgi:sugar-specific transcriptional regulator TrmB
MKNKLILDFLLQLGITSSEANIYLNLLELGPSKVADLNQKKSIPRTTLKENLDKLLNKGLVKRLFKNRTKLYIAEDPSKLQVLLTRNKLDLQNGIKNINNLQNELPNIISNINSLLPTSELRTGILYHGKDKVWEIYKNILNATKTYSVADLDKYYNIFPDTADLWNDSYKTNPEREEWDVVIDTPLARKIISVNIKNYHTKFIPNSYPLNDQIFTDYIVFDDKSAIIQLEENEVMGIVFDSKYITNTMRTLIKLIWDLLPENT